VYFRADQNEIIFERAAITAPIENADPDLCDVLAGVAEDMLGVRSSNPVDRIRLAVSQSLGKSDMGLESVSRSIGVSARALQRRLKQHGTSFTELRREVRQQLAERTLGDPQMTIAEIAYRLGYSEPSEFHRAFRSWTGSSPKQYRRLLSSRNS
jgi:AraC-like DNA-binding protein